MSQYWDVEPGDTLDLHVESADGDKYHFVLVFSETRRGVTRVTLSDAFVDKAFTRRVRLRAEESNE